MKGLSNEVNIRIFCYDPKEEMTVNHFLEQITTDPSLNCNLIECNLYKIFLSACDDLDILDAIPEMEESDGGIFLLETELKRKDIFKNFTRQRESGRASELFTARPDI